MAGAKLKVALLTPERVLFEGEADMVSVPGHDGEIGILPRHVHLVARLGAGIARITDQGKVERFFVSGGFVQVAGETLTILTDDARVPAALGSAEERAQARVILDEALAAKARGEKAMNEKARRVTLARKRLATSEAAAGTKS